jgi:Phage integrase, N-terminal SAM-like domain
MPGEAGDTDGAHDTKRKIMTEPEPAPRKPKQLDAGSFQPEISSFRLHLAAEGKAAKTARTYTEAVQWFAAEHLLKQAPGGWEQVTRQDVQRWMVWLLDRYSSAYASNQYRALQQFFKWLAGEEEIPDPMAGLKPPHVPDKPVPVFGDQDLASIERTCAGRTFAQRRDAAVIAVYGLNPPIPPRQRSSGHSAQLRRQRPVSVPGKPRSASAAACPGLPGARAGWLAEPDAEGRLQ